jgi:centrosomal protein CEP104
MGRLRDLEVAKKKAVEDEDYELAKEIKQQIDNLRKVGNQLADLDRRKRIAVEREDYDSAKIIQE